MASAGSFSAGALMPLVVAAICPAQSVEMWVVVSSLGFLALLGALAARAGGANAWVSVGRVTFWGALAMAITAGVGALFHVAA